MKPTIEFLHFIIRQVIAVCLVSFVTCILIALVIRYEHVTPMGVICFALITAAFSALFTTVPIALGALCTRVGTAFHPDSFHFWSVSSGIFAAALTYYLVQKRHWLEFDGFNWQGILFFGLIIFPSLLAWQKLAERHLR